MLNVSNDIESKFSYHSILNVSNFIKYKYCFQLFNPKITMWIVDTYYDWCPVTSGLSDSPSDWSLCSCYVSYTKTKGVYLCSYSLPVINLYESLQWILKRVSSFWPVKINTQQRKGMTFASEIRVEHKSNHGRNSWWWGCWHLFLKKL